jgi:hypothetical protein
MLPDGYFDVSAACEAGECFRLTSGIQIVGQMPRLQHLPGMPPERSLAPNGGTWLDPGPSNTLFVGEALRGVSLERFGVANFGGIAAFGRDAETGIAFSTIRDLYGIGTPSGDTPRSGDALVFYNIQHLRLEHVKLHNVERGLHVISQSFDWQPGNSVFSDLYVSTYPDPAGAIRLETLESPAAGDGWMMNFITLIRPQVVGAGSTGAPGSAGIWLKGFDYTAPVQLNRIVAAQIDGAFEAAIRMESAAHNQIDVASATDATTGVVLDAVSRFNSISSVDDSLTVSSAGDARNLFLGRFAAAADGMRGLYHDALADRWIADLGYGGRLCSGGGCIWHDDVAQFWRVREGRPANQHDGRAVVRATGPGAAFGPALWAGPGLACAESCSASGMTECVQGWAAGEAVGCSAEEQRRLCACR